MTIMMANQICILGKTEYIRACNLFEISKKAIKQLMEHTESTETYERIFLLGFFHILNILLQLTLLCYCFNNFFSPIKLLIIKAFEDFSNICNQKYI